ncbi:MAG: hypothetical protein AAF645_24660, partial [Myxococcota bacterium]
RLRAMDAEDARHAGFIRPPVACAIARAYRRHRSLLALLTLALILPAMFLNHGWARAPSIRVPEPPPAYVPFTGDAYMYSWLPYARDTLLWSESGLYAPSGDTWVRIPDDAIVPEFRSFYVISDRSVQRSQLRVLLRQLRLQSFIRFAAWNPRVSVAIADDYADASMARAGIVSGVRCDLKSGACSASSEKRSKHWLSSLTQLPEVPEQADANWSIEDELNGAEPTESDGNDGVGSTAPQTLLRLALAAIVGILMNLLRGARWIAGLPPRFPHNQLPRWLRDGTAQHGEERVGTYRTRSRNVATRTDVLRALARAARHAAVHTFFLAVLFAALLALGESLPTLF